MKILLLLFIIANSVQAAHLNVQNWLNRHNKDKVYTLRPTERSQPIIVGENIYYGTESGGFLSVKKETGMTSIYTTLASRG